MHFDPDAFAFAMDPIAVPRRAIDRRTGISMRFIHQYDIASDQNPTRIDVWMMVKASNVKPLDPRVLLCLGAAAVIANPRPIARRNFLGLGWLRGRD